MAARLFDFMQLIRTRFRDEKRRYFRIKKFFIKTYNSHKIANHEYRVINSIRKSGPLTFGVPKILKLVNEIDRVVVIMEREEGTNLETLIFRFLFGQSNIVGIFHRLGQAIHEFHKTDLNMTQGVGIPSSGKEVRDNIVRITKKLNDYQILDDQTVAKIFSATKDTSIDNRLIQVVNLHGEAYFTHILVSEGKFIFLDLERACKGALYYDLATFSTSIYASLLIPRWLFHKLLKLRNAFLRGYFENDIQSRSQIFESMRIAELYMILREIDKIYHNLTSKPALKLKFLYYTKLIRLLSLTKVLSRDAAIKNCLTNRRSQ